MNERIARAVKAIGTYNQLPAEAPVSVDETSAAISRIPRILSDGEPFSSQQTFGLTLDDDWLEIASGETILYYPSCDGHRPIVVVGEQQRAAIGSAIITRLSEMGQSRGQQ